MKYANIWYDGMKKNLALKAKVELTADEGACIIFLNG